MKNSEFKRKVIKSIKLSLVDEYERICNKIAKEFTDKYFGKNSDIDFWVADIVGSVILVSDIFVSMEDMVYCLKNKVSKKMYWEWIDWQMEDQELNNTNLNVWLRQSNTDIN